LEQDYVLGQTIQQYSSFPRGIWIQMQMIHTIRKIATWRLY